MLKLFHAVQREHPELSGRALYQAVIARRLGPDSDPKRAAEIVLRAEESFTDWPVERPLSFRHVVHYQIFDEYMRLGKTHEGTRINMGIMVAHIIPEET